MATLESINEFLAQEHIAVAGVSRKKQKFGNAIYKELNKKGYHVYPINPKLDEYDKKKCYHNIHDLPAEVTAIIINTKNDTTVKLLEESKEQGLKHIWLQQGCADKKTLSSIEKEESNIISEKCIMMFANPVKGIHGFHRWLTKAFGSYPK